MRLSQSKQQATQGALSSDALPGHCECQQGNQQQAAPPQSTAWDSREGEDTPAALSGESAAALPPRLGRTLGVT